MHDESGRSATVQNQRLPPSKGSSKSRHVGVKGCTAVRPRFAGSKLFVSTAYLRRSACDMPSLESLAIGPVRLSPGANISGKRIRPKGLILRTR